MLNRDQQQIVNHIANASDLSSHFLERTLISLIEDVVADETAQLRKKVETLQNQIYELATALR